MLTREDYEFSAKIQRLGNRGVHKAQEVARKAGLPIPYSLNGKLIWEMPDGSITDKKPSDKYWFKGSK